MPLIQFLNRPKNELEAGGRQSAPVQPDENEPVKLCPKCRKSIPLSQLWGNSHCCPLCGHHFRMNSRQRIGFIADSDSFEELFPEVQARDALQFPGYQDKIQLTKKVSGELEAVICGTAKVGGHPCALFVMEPYFMMGSMGTAVGEKIVRLFETATEQKLPVLGFTVSGGARMQEGILSLMQMAKTSGAVKRHSDAGLFYLSVLTDPTTGGVTASFATESDIVLAEPGATVGFAGARVIEQTTRKKLPQGFQTAEFLMEHGFIDKIVPRSQQRQVITALLNLHKGGAAHGEAAEHSV